MGVPGPKLLDDEKLTQDFLSICTPTFVTPDTRANAKLQSWILKGRPLYYFADPHDSHLLDGVMQSWWNKTQSNPLGERYWSCVPYLLGEGQAMMYPVYPRSKVYRHIPRLPLTPPDNYLRDNMVKTLAEQDVDFDIMLQCKLTLRMPIEDAAVRWPERLSPFVPAARLHIPRQNSIPRRSSRSRITCPTIRGTIFRSIVLSATKAVLDEELLVIIPVP